MAVGCIIRINMLYEHAELAPVHVLQCGSRDHIYEEIPTRTHMKHIRMQDVFIRGIILHACFACILVYSD